MSQPKVKPLTGHERENVRAGPELWENVPDQVPTADAASTAGMEVDGRPAEAASANTTAAQAETTDENSVSTAPPKRFVISN